MLIAGDFWNPLSLGDGPADWASFEFAPHRPTDTDAAYGLRTCDRMDFDRGVRVAFERIYADKIRRAAGAGDTVTGALTREARLVAGAVGGFRSHGDDYRFLLRGDGAGAPPRHVSWEYRRFREVVESLARVGLGFERPPPTPGAPTRSHMTPEGWSGMVDRAHLDGAVPWGVTDPAVSVMAILSPRFQTLPSRTGDAYDERMGYIVLHEVVGHAVARLRGARERHADEGEASTTADRVTASLARALPGYTTGAVRNIDVAWNWDPDLGTYDPLRTS